MLPAGVRLPYCLKSARATSWLARGEGWLAGAPSARRRHFTRRARADTLDDRKMGGPRGARSGPFRP